MPTLCYGAGYTHLAVIAPSIHAFAAKSAIGTDRAVVTFSATTAVGTECGLVRATRAGLTAFRTNRFAACAGETVSAIVLRLTFATGLAAAGARCISVAVAAAAAAYAKFGIV